MIFSMTGYGEATTVGEKLTVTTSIRAVNHRYLEIRVRGLEDYRKLETRSEKLIKGLFKRGRIDTQVEVTVGVEEEMIDYDLGRAKRYFQCLDSLCKELQLGEAPNLSHLIRLNGIISEKSLDESELWPVVEKSLSESGMKARKARKQEGEALKGDLVTRLSKLNNHLQIIEDKAPHLKRDYAKKLRKRVEELLEDAKVEINEDRLEEEAILYAERSDISEEITRLHSHLSAFDKLIQNKDESEEPVGNTLDFLAQEMQREANTIGSKAVDVLIKKHAVKIKSQIKKIREQVRNIE